MAGDISLLLRVEIRQPAPGGSGVFEALLAPIVVGLDSEGEIGAKRTM
jgi:hypothetical protein